MGLCESFSEDEAEPFLAQIESEWRIVEDDKKHLKLRRNWKTRNFMSALELCSRFGAIAEEQGHHPDLHLTGWNNLEAVIFTHARDGLLEADFILAAKYDAVPKEDLLSKKKKAAS
ncbi:hypothetical protein WJX73_002354 [Symbiochloris irregularis]|uniref:4a-hydroxytetrahydrobiopterin dehydratase n=1 Tax=Symbiochloris irregularis TaxID=706552 RepID=A0AAW1PQ19_9CHLO